MNRRNPLTNLPKRAHKGTEIGELTLILSDAKEIGAAWSWNVGWYIHAIRNMEVKAFFSLSKWKRLEWWSLGIVEEMGGGVGREGFHSTSFKTIWYFMWNYTFDKYKNQKSF